MPHVYVRTYIISFHGFVLWCCFICSNLTLPSFKKGAFVRNGYFSRMGSIFVFMKQAFFTLNSFS